MCFLPHRTDGGPGPGCAISRFVPRDNGAHAALPISGGDVCQRESWTATTRNPLLLFLFLGLFLLRAAEPARPALIVPRKHKEASRNSSPLMIPGRAPLVELRSPACGTKQLRPGYPVAPTGNRLWLLPSGPDQIHRSAPHRTQPSTPLGQAVPATVEPSEGNSTPL